MISKVLRTVRPLMARGPKKKGGAVKKDDTPVSADISNIWKERTDPEIKEDNKEYPLWLMKICRGTGTVDGYMRAWATGDRKNYPELNDVLTLKNQIKKSKAKGINMMRKEMRGGLDEEETLPDYRGENKLSRHVDEEDMQRMLEE